MKRRRERRKAFRGKLHARRQMLHVHLSKELKAKAGTKARSLLVNKGDTVKVLRGGNKGKSAKVARVSAVRKRIFLEGISSRNRRGVESLIPFEPSNLVLTELKETPYRKEAMKGA